MSEWSQRLYYAAIFLLPPTAATSIIALLALVLPERTFTALCSETLLDRGHSSLRVLPRLLRSPSVRAERKSQNPVGPNQQPNQVQHVQKLRNGFGDSYIYIYIYIYIQSYICIDIYIRLCIYVCIYVCSAVPKLCIYTDTYIYIYIYLRLYLCLYLHLYLYLCLYL